MPTRALRKIRDGLLSLAYPEECRVCGQSVESWDDGIVCDRCWADPKITRLLLGVTVCQKCGAPKDVNSNQRSSGGTAESSIITMPGVEWLCGRCSTLPFASARACGLYSGSLEASVLFLKSRPHVCNRLREIIEQTFSNNRAALTSDLVMPVPLHRARERERGFNQATIIAKIVARAFGLPFDNQSVKRIKHTEQHRAGLDAIDRARSVDRAFEATRPRLIEKTSVLLVDDVYTTGSTVCAIAKVLLEAGAERVSVLTIARAMGTLNLPQSR